MAKGRDKHKAREAAIAGLGRELARRARSRCELCSASGVSLKVVEVPPVDGPPDPDRAAMICHACREGVEGGRLDLDPDRWRFLETAIWSEIPAAQVLCARLARRLQDDGVEWIRGALDGLYLDPEIEEWVAG